MDVLYNIARNATSQVKYKYLKITLKYSFWVNGRQVNVTFNCW